MTPEESIETGIYNRLTDSTYGIIVDAGKYCADEGGVQLFQGQLSLEPDSLAEWAKTGLNQGPVVLIMAGSAVDYQSSKVEFVEGEYTIDIYIAAANYRTTHEALAGDAGGDTRGPGIWQVKADILDRLLNYPIVSDSSPAWVIRGRLLAVNKALCLYQLTLGIVVANYHNLVAWGDRDDLSKIRTTIKKDNDDDSLIVQVDNDYP